jgi:amidase
MHADELALLDATAQAALIRTGAVSRVEMLDAAINRIERLNPRLNAVVLTAFTEAREAAQRSPKPRGSFSGVPMLVKDLDCRVAGLPLTEGMQLLRDRGGHESSDGYYAARLRAAGFALIGRTSTSELGILPTAESVAYGPTRNPWAFNRSSGGSSGGSAAAVAAGMVAIAHGSDGAGSIRIPAGACGLVGLKPSRMPECAARGPGEVMRQIMAEHVITRSVRDSAAVLRVMGQHSMASLDRVAVPPIHADALPHDPGRLRIGLLTTPPGAYVDCDPECVTAVHETGALLEKLGHEVEVSAPAALLDREALRTRGRLWVVGAAWRLRSWARRTGSTITRHDVEQTTWLAAQRGWSVSRGEFGSMVETLGAWTIEMLKWWRTFDLLVTPTTAMPAPPLGYFGSPADDPMRGLVRGAEYAPFTSAFNVTGQPAISLPLGWSRDGTPIGVQLVAGVGRDDLLIEIAARIEEAHPWATPGLPSGDEVPADPPSPAGEPRVSPFPERGDGFGMVA